MQEKFIAAWQANREKAALLGVRMRPVEAADAMRQAHRILGSNRCSDGFDDLARLGKLSLSLEALAVDKRYTGLFSDEEANAALEKLPAEMAAAVHLVYFEEMTYAQAAKVMKKSPKQVDNLLYRAKKELRIILGEDGEQLL